MSTIIDLGSAVSIGPGTAATDGNHSGPADPATTPSPVAKDSQAFAVFGCLLLAVIALAAVIGNVLVILSVYTNRKLRTITNLFVVSLAVADLMVGALVLPFAAKAQATQSWDLGSAICDIWISLDVLLCTASILNLCCISIDRYFAITRPLVCATKRNRRHASVMIAAVWCLSAVITSPPLLGWKEANRSTDGGTCELTKERGYVVYSAMGSFYIPLAIMIFVYVNIFVVARNAHRRWRGQTGRSVSLCSLIKDALPVSMKSSDCHRSPDAEQRKKVLRVSTRSSSSVCLPCCLGDVYWTEAVVADGDWRVSRGAQVPHHVTHGSCSGQVEIVTCGDARWMGSVADDAGTPSAAIPAAVTSPETEETTDNVFSDDVISGTKNTVETRLFQRRSNVQRYDRLDEYTTFEGRRSNDPMVSRRRHSFVDLGSCAHAPAETEVVFAYSREEGGSCKRKQKFQRSDSLPAHAPKTRDQHSLAAHAPKTRDRHSLAAHAPKTRDRHSLAAHAQETRDQRRGDAVSEDAVPKNLETEEAKTKTRYESRLAADSCEAFATFPRWKRRVASSSTDPRKTDGIPAPTALGQQPTRPKTQTPIQRLRIKTAQQRRENSTVLRERKTAKTVSIVVGCFVLCWLPFFIVYIAEPFFPNRTFNETMKKWFVWLGYFNSVINPFIYAFYNHDFRFTFWRLTLGRVWGSRRLPKGISPSSPNNNVNRFQSGQRERSISGADRPVIDM